MKPCNIVGSIVFGVNRALFGKLIGLPVVIDLTLDSKNMYA